MKSGEVEDGEVGPGFDYVIVLVTFPEYRILRDLLRFGSSTKLSLNPIGKDTSFQPFVQAFLQ